MALGGGIQHQAGQAGVDAVLAVIRVVAHLGGHALPFDLDPGQGFFVVKRRHADVQLAAAGEIQPVGDGDRLFVAKKRDSILRVSGDMMNSVGHHRALAQPARQRAMLNVVDVFYRAGQRILGRLGQNALIRGKKAR